MGKANPILAGEPDARLVQYLVEARQAAHLSQAALADALNLRQPDISKIEKRERRIDAIECLRWLIATSRARGRDPADDWRALHDVLVDKAS